VSTPGPHTGEEPRPEPRYEPPPGVGKLVLWILLFVVAAVVVVAGGVYFG
jgi:flagellar basal body-associated protein FliL